MKGKLTALIWPFLGLLLFAALLWVERTGVTSVEQKADPVFLPNAEHLSEKRKPETECLVLYNGKADKVLYGTILYVLDSMSVGYHLCDVNADQSYDLSQYRTVVLALTNLDLMQPSILRILDWTQAGGQLLFAYSPEPSDTLNAIGQKLGILNLNLDYGVQSRARLITPLMPGGEGQEFKWSDDDREGLVVQLADTCLVHMVSVDHNQDKTAMLWECPLGRGKVVVNNNDAFVERKSRGMIAAVYSLLGDAFCYPVINASMFFIDDFPAPIPEGHNEYIDKFYDMDVESFYTKIWFPSMLSLARKYDLRYTALMIETYEDNVAPPFTKSAQIERYRYFGNILLQDGHEIGLHGYNHMPLVLPAFDYKGQYDYKKWASADDMSAALREAIRFSGQAIPGARLKTYVPPSNVLSKEGRQMLRSNFPQINTISSLYLSDDDDLGYLQEFGVEENGTIDLPRIIAGCELSDYDRWTVLCELNFHYVNSHFLHPDDSLDPDRGANLGWERLSTDLDDHLHWLYGSAKGLRNLTAQQGAMAVQRYCSLSVQRKFTDGSYQIDLGGFYNNAWLLVRLNSGSPGPVKGGSLELVCGNLYLLHATAAHVEIALKDGGQS